MGNSHGYLISDSLSGIVTLAATYVHMPIQCWRSTQAPRLMRRCERHTLHAIFEKSGLACPSRLVCHQVRPQARPRESPTTSSFHPQHRVSASDTTRKLKGNADLGAQLFKQSVTDTFEHQSCFSTVQSPYSVLDDPNVAGSHLRSGCHHGTGPPRPLRRRPQLAWPSTLPRSETDLISHCSQRSSGMTHQTHALFATSGSRSVTTLVTTMANTVGVTVRRLGIAMIALGDTSS